MIMAQVVAGSQETDAKEKNKIIVIFDNVSFVYFIIMIILLYIVFVCSLFIACMIFLLYKISLLALFDWKIESNALMFLHYSSGIW